MVASDYLLREAAVRNTAEVKRQTKKNEKIYTFALAKLTATIWH
jgi:hypothetical protein